MSERLAVAPRPEELPALRVSDTVVLAAPTAIARIYREAGPHPVQWNDFRLFGPTATGRFDPQLAPPRRQERGVLYAAAAWRRHARAAGFTCVAEAFQDTRTVERARGRPSLATFRLQDPVRLLDLTSGWVTRAGGNQAICSGERDRARGWARSIYARYADVEGVTNASATYGPGRAVALFERARHAIPRHPSAMRALDDPALLDFLRRAADELGYVLV